MLPPVFKWFNHLVIVECAADCRFCARNAAKIEKKKKALTRRDRACLEAVYDLGEDARMDRILQRLGMRWTGRPVGLLVSRLEELKERGFVHSRIVQEHAISGVRRLYRIDPAGSEALGKPMPVAAPLTTDTKTLAELMRSRESFSVKQIVYIGIGVCFETNYAHKTGMAHGDIRPPNIVIARGAKVSLINFDKSGTASPEDDVRAIGMLLCRLMSFAKEHERLKEIAEAAAYPNKKARIDSVEQLQHSLEMLVYDDPPSTERMWVFDLGEACLYIFFFAMVYFWSHPDQIPASIRDFFLSGWFTQ